MRKVLVVDDDADMRQTLLGVLSPVAEVISAADGVQALSRIKAERPSLMLLDIAMPDMGGLEVLRAGLQLDPSLIVVMLTGECDMTVAKTALERGARAYITKPVDPRGLREEVEFLLGLRVQPSGEGPQRPWRVVG